MQLAFLDLDALYCAVPAGSLEPAFPSIHNLLGIRLFGSERAVQAKLSAPKLGELTAQVRSGLPATHELVQPRFDMQPGIEWGPQTD